jgi:hypothetical protein
MTAWDGESASAVRAHALPVIRQYSKAGCYCLKSAECRHAVPGRSAAHLKIWVCTFPLTEWLGSKCGNKASKSTTSWTDGNDETGRRNFRFFLLAAAKYYTVP